MSGKVNRPPLFLLLVLLMTSCLENIDLDTGERILNVYCILGQGPEQTLELSYIAPTGGTSSVVGEDVTIMLYDEDAPVGEFTRASETKWHLSYSPQGGHSYRLEVSVAGEEPLTAETRFPRFGTLQFFTVTWEGFSRFVTGFKMDAPEDQILWCRFDNTLAGPSFAEFIVTDHPGVDGRGETIYPFDPASLYPNEGWLNSFCPGGGVFNNLFSNDPPFFHEKVLRVLHPANFTRPLGEKILKLYQDGSNMTQDYGRTSIFGIGGMTRSAMIAELVIESVSPEYDHYLSEYYYGEDTDDFSKYVYSRNFYSNVLNGTGIFGASYAYQRRPYRFEKRL